MAKRLLEPGLVDALRGIEVSPPCPRCDSDRQKLVVNSVHFDIIDLGRFLDACDRFGACRAAHVVHFLSVHPTVVARDVDAYGKLLNNADLVVPDGAPIAAVLRARDRTARRLTGTDAFLAVCEASSSRKLKHFFVGGATPRAANALQSEIGRRFPDLELVGFEVPPFRPYTDKELRQLAAAISDAGADVVWIGIGAPKQEILAHRLRLLGAAPVIACIGATFDFVAGTKARAPRWMQAAGLEWLFRLGQEPGRLWRRYLIGNARFVGAVAIDEVRRLHPSHATEAS